MTVTLEKVGSRLYFAGNTYPIKDSIKRIGGHWDGDRKQWWVGTAKAPEAEALLAGTGEEAQAESPAAAGDEPGDKRVYAKVTYKGGTYYVIAESREQGRCRLCRLTGPAFWADMIACELLKTYAPRERSFRGRTTTEYTTLGSIRRFIAQQQRAEARGDEPCAACGKRGPLHHDLEDGLMKCHACCDIPA